MSIGSSKENSLSGSAFYQENFTHSVTYTYMIFFPDQKCGVTKTILELLLLLRIFFAGHVAIRDGTSWENRKSLYGLCLRYVSSNVFIMPNAVF